MTTIYERATVAAALTACDYPVFVAAELDGTEGGPLSSADGVSLAVDTDRRALRTLVQVHSRPAEGEGRSVDVTISLNDAATTYTLRVGGVAGSVSGGVDASATAAALAAMITPPAGITLAVADDTIRIRTTSTAWYSVQVSASGGAGTMTTEADASHGRVRVWGLPGGSVTGARWSVVDDRPYAWGLFERYDTGGIARLHVEVYDLRGAGDTGPINYRVTRLVGPSDVRE